MRTLYLETILLAVVWVGLCLLATSCSHKRVMSDCKHINDNYWECED